MKRWVIWIHLPLTILLVIMLDYMTVDGRPATELWRPELMDELTSDEWPVGEEETNSNDDDDDDDARIYEMEALMAERHEQIAADDITDRMNDNDNEEEEEEDDVDQDDYDSEEEEEETEEEDDDGGNGKVANQGNTGQSEEPFGSQQSFDSRINNDVNNEVSIQQKYNDDYILINKVTPLSTSSSPKATSKLQQQEEQALEVLDQSIVDTLRAALDTVKQDRPQRFIPLDENKPITSDALVETQTPSSSSSSLSISLFLSSGFHVPVSWSSYWILGTLLTLVTLSYRKFRQQPIRDYHHLPIHSVYKQKSSVD